MSKDLMQRLGVAVIGIPALLFIFYLGNVLLFMFLGLLSLLGMWEFHNMLSKAGKTVRTIDVLISFTFFATVCSIVENRMLETVVIMVLFFLISLKFVLRTLGTTNTDDFKIYLHPLLGWVYTGIIPGLVFILGEQYQQEHYLLLLLILIWITDSAAYFIGMRFGRNRGIFPVSPRKSLEGFIAGIITPVLVSLIIYKMTDYWSLLHLLLLAVSAGVFGQLGDLFESKLKRIGKVKDSSNIIPGHGGVLDRFDSLLFAAPVFFIFIKIFP